MDGIKTRAPGHLAQQVNQSGNVCVAGCFKFRTAVLRHLAVPALALLLGSAAAFAQSGNPAAQEQGKAPAASAADGTKENQRKTDEFVEAQQAINGPAGNPECVWLGRRVVTLMWRDDLDTAFRHLDLYDRFGCPGGHVQASFRCLTRFGSQIDDKVPRVCPIAFRPAGSIRAPSLRRQWQRRLPRLRRRPAMLRRARPPRLPRVPRRNRNYPSKTA